MTASPISSTSVALLGAAPPLEKRVTPSPGATDTLSNFEQLLRATPGSRPFSIVAKSQVGSQAQVTAADAKESDLPSTELLDLASSRPRLAGKRDEETDLFVAEPLAVAAVPSWPAHLAAAWDTTGQACARDAKLPADFALVGPEQSEVVVTLPSPGIPASMPVMERFAVSTVKPPSTDEPDVASAFASLGSTPAGLSTLVAVPIAPNATASTDQPLARSPAEVSVKATSVLPGGLLSGSLPVDGAQPSKLVAPVVRWVPAVLTSAPVGMEPQHVMLTPARVRLSGPAEATAPRLSAEPRAVDTAAVVLAQCGVVRVFGSDEIEHAHNKGSATLSEAYLRADAFGTWVPELGGLISPADGPSEPVGFAQQLAEQVDTWVTQNLQVAEIRVQEPNSTPVLVRIEMTGQQANVIFLTDVPACREALASQIDQLSDLLSAQGLQLGGASVGGSGADTSSRREAAPVSVSGWSAPMRSAPEVIAMTPSTSRPARSGGQTLDVFV